MRSALKLYELALVCFGTLRLQTKKKPRLELQRQKDMIFNAIETIYERCAAIKAQIKKEQDLEATVEEMTNRIKDRSFPFLFCF